jgi:hypothetical protein
VREGEQPDLFYLLTDREKKGVRDYGKAYKKRFKRKPELDKNLFVYLGDNPTNRLTWSAVSKKIPTLRMSGGKMWNMKARRWLTGREKLSSLGFPVTDDVASTMGVPPLPVRDTKRASSVAGNAMNFSSVAIMQLISLVCFRKVS